LIDRRADLEGGGKSSGWLRLVPDMASSILLASLPMYRIEPILDAGPTMP